MSRPLFFLWLLLAGAAAVWGGQAKAAGTKFRAGDLLPDDASKMTSASGYAVAGRSDGVLVGANYPQRVTTSLARPVDVPLRASVIIPKDLVRATAAATCVAFPLKCVGDLALGLAAGWVLDQALGSIVEPGQTVPAGQCRRGTDILGNNVTAQQCAALQRQAAGDNREVYCPPLAPNQPAGTGNVCTTTTAPFSDRGSYIASGGTMTTAPRPLTEAEIEASFANRAATWQDTTFAAVYGAAVTAGAKFPLTIFSGAEMAGTALPAETLSETTVTGPNGEVSTVTKTSQLVTTTTGTTVGTAEAEVTERVVTVTTGPDGTMTEETETAPQTQTQTQTEVTVNVEFPPVEFDDTPLPEVPALYQQKYADGFAGVWARRSAEFAATPFISSVTGMFSGFGAGGTCPAFLMPLDFGVVDFGTADLSPPCWLWDVAALILLTTAVFTARRIVTGG